MNIPGFPRHHFPAWRAWLPAFVNRLSCGGIHDGLHTSNISNRHTDGRQHNYISRFVNGKLVGLFMRQVAITLITSQVGDVYLFTYDPVSLPPQLQSKITDIDRRRIFWSIPLAGIRIEHGSRSWFDFLETCETFPSVMATSTNDQNADFRPARDPHTMVHEQWRVSSSIQAPPATLYPMADGGLLVAALVAASNSYSTNFHRASMIRTAR